MKNWPNPHPKPKPTPNPHQTLKTVVKAATRTDVVHHMLQDPNPDPT